MQELDPRIYQLADTPDVIAERGAKLQEAQDKIRQARQTAQDAQATRQAFQQWTDPQTGLTDYNKVIGQLMRTSPTAGANAQKFFDEHLDKMAQTEKQNWENETAKGKVLGNIASSIHDQPSLDAWRQASHPEIATALPQVYDAAGQARIKQLEQAGLTGGERETRLHNAFKEWMSQRNYDRGQPDFIEKASRSAASIFSNMSVDDGTAFLKSATTLGFPPEAITPLFSKTPEEAAQMALTPNERAVRADAAAGRAIQQTGQAETARHNQATESIARTNAALSQQREGRLEAASAPSKPIEVGTPDYKVAQDLALGRMTTQFFRTLEAYNRDAGKKAAIYAKATEINPNFNQADFERGFKFISNTKTGNQLASLDNALSGIPSLLEASDAAQRSGVPLLNSYTNPVKVAIGSKKFANLKLARLAWADEVSGALGFGTASDMKLQLGLDLTDTTLSPAAFKEAITTVVEPFLRRKNASMLKQASVYGTPENNSSITPPTPSESAPKKVGKYTIIEHK